MESFTKSTHTKKKSQSMLGFTSNFEKTPNIFGSTF